MPDGGGVGLYHFAEPPPLPVVEQFDQLRRAELESLHGNGEALVEYDVVALGSVRSLRSITKQPTDPNLPLARSGLTYVGTLTLPFEQRSFVIRVRAREVGPAGVREATIMTRGFAQGRIQRTDDGQIQGWIPPPPPGSTLLDANVSEHPALDKEFPAHPLTRVRVALAQITQTLMISQAVLREPAFPLPEQ